MKKRNCEPQDRLSELSDSLIFEIFWLLPMTDVVQTTVLSTRWKNLWKTSPYLNFNSCYERNFLKRAILIYRKETSILKLKIDLLGKSLLKDLDFWVRFTKEKGVRELYLRLDLDMEEDEPLLWVPQCLYLCSSLKELSMFSFNVGIDDVIVNWNQLKSLTFGGEGAFISERAVAQILSGSPQLEELTMYVMENSENLSMLIESSSLKRLMIEKYFDRHSVHNPSTNTELRICTPKLEEFVITGAPYSKCLLINVSSLTHVTLGFEWKDCRGHHLISWNEVLEKTLSQIYPAIQHVTRVKLSHWCIKVIIDMVNKMILPLTDVKLWQLYGFVAENKQE